MNSRDFEDEKFLASNVLHKKLTGLIAKFSLFSLKMLKNLTVKAKFSQGRVKN